MATAKKTAPAKRTLAWFGPISPGLRYLGTVAIRERGKETVYTVSETPGSGATSFRSFVFAKVADSRESYFVLARAADEKVSCNCVHGERRAKDGTLKPCRHASAIKKLIDSKRV